MSVSSTRACMQLGGEGARGMQHTTGEGAARRGCNVTAAHAAGKVVTPCATITCSKHA